MIAAIDDLRLEKFLRKREAGELVWKTKSGDIIPIKDLEDNHLDNILNTYNRNFHESKEIKASSLNVY